MMTELLPPPPTLLLTPHTYIHAT